MRRYAPPRGSPGMMLMMSLFLAVSTVASASPSAFPIVGSVVLGLGYNVSWTLRSEDQEIDVSLSWTGVFIAFISSCELCLLLTRTKACTLGR